jgi:hypothetical protein
VCGEELVEEGIVVAGIGGVGGHDLRFRDGWFGF